MGVKSGMGLSWGLVGMGKEEMQKTCFSAVRVIYTHYFEGIRQGALQSDCVMLLGRVCMPRAGSASEL